MSTIRIQHVVWRQEKIEPTCVTIISANRTHMVCSPDDLYERLVRAITNWMKKTSTGKQAWIGSSGEFNVGDLASYVDDVTLRAFLQDEGVVDLSIVTPEESKSWESYDTLLLDSGDVEAFYDNQEAGEEAVIATLAEEACETEGLEVRDKGDGDDEDATEGDEYAIAVDTDKFWKSNGVSNYVQPCDDSQ